jgi:hypothetical protein
MDYQAVVKDQRREGDVMLSALPLTIIYSHRPYFSFLRIVNHMTFVIIPGRAG